MTGTTHEDDATAEARRLAVMLVRLSGGSEKLGDFDLVEQIAMSEQLVSWAKARAAARVAELVRRPCMQPTSKPRNSEALSPDYIAATVLAARLRWTQRRAENTVHDYLFLTDQAQGTLAALRRGDLDLDRARAVREYASPVADDAAIEARAAGATREEARRVADDVCARIEDRVLAQAPRQNLTQFKLALNRAAQAVDPQAATRRAARARKDRRVWIRPEPDAMAVLGARLGVEDGIRVHNALVDHARALRKAGDPRTVEQLKADLLVDLITGRAPNGYTADAADLTGAPTKPTRAERTTVRVTVALPTLLGLDDEPGELGGYGPIPADLARQIAADPTSTWYRLITDPVTGVLKHVDTTRYSPSAPLLRHIQIRDVTCTHIGCPLPAERCDCDHRREFRNDGTGGGTCEHNTNPRCGRHHRCKHETGWRVDRIREHDTDCPDAGTVTGDDLGRPESRTKITPQDRELVASAPEGTLVYQAPTGHLFLVPPEPVLPVNHQTGDSR